MEKVILFDLDGTLTESGEGITKSVAYALEKMGRPEPDLEKLRVFIGPPLQKEFMQFCGFSEREAETAVKYYRERYAVTGIFENRPYPGIPEMLDRLSGAGFSLGVASSKPEYFVLQILEHFGIRKYFAEVVGATMDETRTDKAEVIREALRKFGMEDCRENVWMVGDREHDVIGARTAGVRCIAVTYGYGSAEELLAVCPDAIAGTVEDLEKLLLEDAPR